MARRRIDPAAGMAALKAVLAGDNQRHTIACAVRYLLEELSQQLPGGAVEVRVPPYGVVQCAGGAQHTRGTPPNVVECDGPTWIALACGQLSWPAACAAGVLHASGERADLRAHLPLLRPKLRE